ncbi:multiple PDZ domain protein-like isoform X9 [Mercenaria mercenaria]|uniref:multiple PDZ domain protein-like isoform X9 n=1 Tax=Mercenaria mercenaria TaxID=6596 RepID=UPI00234E5FAA|nr:multiple PDZ domain protein-like isoform X9 [Mercenaria mercenaria]
MSMIHDSDHAAECLDHLQTMLWESGDHTQDDDISSLICMLQSPLFRQLLVLQDSIQELEQVNESQGLDGYDFNFLPELQLESTGLANSAFEPETTQASSFPYETTPEYKDEFEKVIKTAAKGREVETIKLFKPEKQSLGFSVVANPGDPSIYVQDIQPGGIADRHGRLRERDQILAIDGQPLDISHQEAIRILQSAGGLVEIVVARGPNPQAASTPGDQEEQVTDSQTQNTAEVTDMLNTEWTQIEVIDLINDGSGLGFGIIGGRSTGVVVKTILPGGVADVDGRLHSGDHILQIGDVDVRGYGSEQVAQVLRQAGSHVRLIVARPINEPTSIPTPDAPIVPTIQLDQHLEQITSMLDKRDQMLIENQMEQQNHVQKGMVEHAEVHQPPYGEELPPEVDYFDVNLLKDTSQGLGITIAGYVGRDNNPDDLCGIFVKSITPGSAAAQDGQIQVNDQIIEVDGQPLQGFSNHDAVEVLRNTGQVVHLKLARYQHGAKFEKLQQYLAQPQMYVQQPPPVLPVETTTIATPRYELNTQPTQQSSVDNEDSVSQIQDDLDGELSPDIEAAIRACWEPIVGDEFEVVVAQLSKFKEGGGLGISLEGTVDVENGVEVRPHHYIRAILPDGPVGVNGRLHSGDELLEVNGKRLLGLNHKEVVGILKELPQNVRLVCARRTASTNENYAEQDVGQFQTPPLNSGVIESFPERLVKSKSDNALSDTVAQTNLSSKKSRSLEPLTGLAMWSNEPVVIELRKGDKGLGFSILDYQDPVNPSETVIVIRSLVPGGVAQMDGRLVPGDRLVFVNDVNLESATLDEAVQALKGAQKGLVRIGVAKPLPLAGPFQEQPVSEEEQEHKAPLPSPRKMSPESENASKKRPKPAIPPKPKPSQSPYSEGSPKVKDEPPPLPVSSPPPLLNKDEETKTQTSPGVSEVIKVATNAAVENIPPSDHSLTADQLDTSDHRQEPLDSSFSSDQFNTSDLKTVSASSSSTPRTASPGISPITSPSLMRSFSGPDAFPPSLEKRITLKRSQNNLGMTVEATDKGINGCVVKSLTKTGAIYKDGRIQVGDYIMAINNESMRRITNTQARVILRRASLMGSADISISYVTAADGAAHKEAVAKRPPESPSTPTMMPSPKIFPKYYRSTLSPVTKRSSLSDGSAPSSPLSSPRKTASPASASPKSTTPQVSPRQKETVVVGSGNQTWGPPRLVELHREPGKTLGISIVGGRVDMFHVTEEHMISGIFIKHVLEDSPAGRNGTLKTGDRILQVDGKDLRNATHDQAVDTIRHASNPVRFVIQSLTDPACPRDLETDNKSVHSYDEGLQSMQQSTQVVSQNQVVESPVQASSPVPATESTPPTTVKPEEEVLDQFGYSLERIQRRYGDLNGELLLVELTRGSSGLGISLAGNKDRNTMSVFVAGIQPDSAAGQDGQIQVGDELLEVNGSVLYGRSHLNASAIIKGINTPVIKIVLLRREDNLDRMAVKPIKVTSPLLNKQEKKAEPVPLTTPTSEPATLSPTPSEEKQPVSPTGSNMLDVIQVISLNKGPSGLGFAIVEENREGRQGIYVRSITFGGVADRDTRLSVGDQILEVQDKSLQDVHYDKAIDILRNSQGTVRLKVRKCNADGSQYAQNNVQGQVSLPNPPGESSTDAASPNQVSEAGSHDPLTCPIIPGQEMAITIEKGRTGLGLSIVGGADTLLGAIIIHEVYEDGAAARDGRLWAGDQVLEVNHENLREATHDYAIQVLRQTPATVNMVIFRDDTHIKEEDIYDIFTVELLKKPGKGLGLSIVGKRNDVGVYISDIVKGGAAEADGRLMQGDQILAVNSEDMRNATQEYAAAVLKTTMGKVTLNVGRLKAGSRTSSRKNSNGVGGGLRKSESTASNKSKGGRHSKKGSEDMSHIRVVELAHDANGSLGLSIAGGVGSSLGDTPILVANMTSGGPAERSRKLKVGDKILSINGVNTEGMNHEQVVNLLKSSNDSITLQVTQGEQTQVSVSGRSSSTRGSTRGSTSGAAPEIPTVRTPTPQENNVFEDEEAPPQYKTITLERGPDGLGFSIVGGHGSPHGDLPIYVKNVFSKGAASENGQLKRGDQILTVNGSSLDGLTHEEAVNILKNAKGSVIMNVLS